jgi:hypothetical protein
MCVGEPTAQVLFKDITKTGPAFGNQVFCFYPCSASIPGRLTGSRAEHVTAAGGALVFAAGLGVIAGAYFYTNVSRTLLFWSAFILTRPLGATLGNLLDKPLDNGGLAVSRYYASAILAAIIVACIFFLPQRAGKPACRAASRSATPPRST